jgi:Glycosyl transferase family group 2
MQTHAVIKDAFLYRFTEKALPILVWLTITMPLWLSPFHPAVVSYLILAYFIYFLYKSLKMSYFATISFRLLSRAARTDWRELLATCEGSTEIQNYVMVVTTNASEAKLEKTLDHLKDQDIDHSQLHVVLAMEERSEGCHDRGDALLKKYRKDFASMHAFYHVLTVGEVIGKASNATFAAREISKLAEKNGYDPEKVVVTVCDEDSLLPTDYIPYLNYKYLMDEDGRYRFFAAPVLLYNNFWKLPFPVRMQMMLSSVARVGFLSQKDDLIQISTYSTSLWLLESIGYWDVDIIPEDWHIWMQAFFELGAKVRTIPLYVLIVRDGILAPTWFKTLRARYQQEKRWAWGATDVPYIVARFFTSPHINFWVKLRRLAFVAENHFMWPTAFFLLTISASLPTLVNPAFERTVLGFLLPKLASFILTCSSCLLILGVYYDFKLRKKVKIDTSWKNVPLLFIQWYLLPVVSFAFSALPALEAHTRMLLGKKIEYKLTEKMG